MPTTTASYLDELAWRGLLYQHTEGVAGALAAGPVTAYCGFDPTAPSLHVGHLVPVMGLVHLQRAGHRPIALVGGGTGLIGDPSGRTTERALNSPEVVRENVAALRRQLERFIDFSGTSAARMMDNAEWLMPLRAVDFMRDVGKHFTVNFMLAKESVKSRIDSGISFTEFSYMLLQAYDFLELHRRAGVTLQVGGSDQWGNMTAGMELIRRTVGGDTHVVTFPLVTKADGTKFGKSEAGSVWLDAERTSPYRFYQFWVNADDRDVGRYLRYFTLLPREEIEALDAATAERPEAREAQQALARDVTARVHGEDALRAALDASRALFDRRADPRELSPAALRMLEHEIPFATLDWVNDAGEPAGGAAPRFLPVFDALVAAGLVKSKGEARRVLQQGGVSVNGRKLAADESRVAESAAIDGNAFLVRKGAREMALVRAH